MTCQYCSPAPGKLIPVDNIRDPHCTKCGRDLSPYNKSNKKWDNYFHKICIAVSGKSPCLSRKIGAILVRDNSILSTGYNGPPRGIPHCGHERIISDLALDDAFRDSREQYDANYKRDNCPRKVLGYPSGTHMELCPAQHAEENAVSNAARLGTNIFGSTLYMNCIIPCKNCLGTLINAGIVEIVVEDVKVYDKYTQFFIDNSNIKIRRFEL